MYKFLYPIKDTYITQFSEDSDKNFGGDTSLVLKKYWPDHGTYEPDYSCPLLQYEVKPECYFEDYNVATTGAKLDSGDVVKWSALGGSAMLITNYLTDHVISKGDGSVYNWFSPPAAPTVDVSRILLQFDLTKISSSIVNGDIPKAGNHPASSSFYLRLYDKKTHGLSPEYTLAAYPMSQSWEEGTGYSGENPNSEDGATWERGNSELLNTSWSFMNYVGDQSYTLSHENRGNKFGGGCYYTSSGDLIASQSFSYESPDINMNVTDIVKQWLEGTKTNNGMILRFSGSQESSTNIIGDMSFYSMEAQSIYSPKLEIKWDDHAACSGSNTGSLNELDVVGTKNNDIYVYGTKEKYRDTETAIFRVRAKEKYVRGISWAKTSLNKYFIPEHSGSYSIVDLKSGKTIIPFGNYSYLSCDSISNYFKLDLNSFITNRKYKIKLQLKQDDGTIRNFDNNCTFEVIN